MRYLFTFMCVLALGLMGCSETTGTGGSGGSDLCEGVMCEDDSNECTENVCNPADGTCGVAVENGTACSSGACLDATCTSLVMVGGIVAFGGAPPAEGSRITVSVDGTSLSMTTSVSGSFFFDVFPGDWFFVTSKEDMVWGGIQLVSVPSTGQRDLQLSVGADADIVAIEEECVVEIDDARGIVSLYFVPTCGEGGEAATFSVPHGGAVTEDADGNCVVSEMLLAGGGAEFGGEIDYLNVDLTEELIVTPIAPEGCECVIEPAESVQLVRASFHTSGVDVRCTPVP